MARSYMIAFDNIAVSAAQDLFEILPADDKPVKLIEAHASAVDSETAETLRFQVLRMNATVTSGSGGAAVTPVPTDVADTAFGGTVERNNTTLATTSGTTYTMASEGADVRAGWHYVASPGREPKAIQGEGLFIRLPTAPGSATNMSGWAVIEEGI